MNSKASSSGLFNKSNLVTTLTPEETRYRWVVLSTGFFANLVSFGLIFSFGIFLGPLSSELGWNVSILGTAYGVSALVQTSLSYFAGRLTDATGPKLLMALSGLLLGSSMLVMSQISSTWQLFLVYGFLFPMGIAAAYSPATSTVSQWFEARRGFAVGLAASGIGFGSLLFSPLSSWLISSNGFREAYLILGIITFAAFAPISILIKASPSKRHSENIPTSEQRKSGVTFNQAFRTKPFRIIWFSWMFASVAGLGVPLYVVPLITDRGITSMTAAIIAGLIGGGGIVGRIIAGIISDRHGRTHVFRACLALQTATMFWLLFFTNDIWVLSICIFFFGIGYGGWAGLMGAFPVDYFGFAATGAILGFMVLATGIGTAIGSFSGGNIYDVTGSYNLMIVLFIAASTAALILALLLKGPSGYKIAEYRPALINRR